MGVECIWDLDDDPDGNVQHLAEHGVTIDEVQEVIDNPWGTDSSRSSDRPILFGWTSTGRFLAIVYENVEHNPQRIYVVTAFEANPPKVN